MFYMVAELIRVFFLHEAYAVGRTFHLLKEKATAIHNVYRFIGFLDSILSVAILRRSYLITVCQEITGQESDCVHRQCIIL